MSDPPRTSPFKYPCGIVGQSEYSLIPSLISKSLKTSKVLNSLGIQFGTFDVLSDFAMREGIKEYSDWPTIPQVYLKGEFLGGSDILIEMYNSGTLKEKIEIELAS